jgi:hypothetical protein
MVCEILFAEFFLARRKNNYETSLRRTLVLFFFLRQAVYNLVPLL